MPPSLDVAFVTRAPTEAEELRLALVLSTFCDGSGMNSAGCLPGWRDVERTVAAVFNGRGSENKDVFDVAVSPNGVAYDVGISVKCKNLPSSTAMTGIETTRRVYMELANSPAKFWKALGDAGLTEVDFKGQREPEKFGGSVLDTVYSWHVAAATAHVKNTGRALDLEHSIYLTLSNGTRSKGTENVYQWHSFPLRFADDIHWEFRSPKSLRGLDPKHPSEVLFDWYPFSGGQLKYYPRASDAPFRSKQFTLQRPPAISLFEKAATYFPSEWAKAQALRDDE
ncbi:MAG: hypothetical protein H0U23_11450 [Blastocatellia bacterium]|nr:hypothetical protein [Blastocatellia bacterium]